MDFKFNWTVFFVTVALVVILMLVKVFFSKRKRNKNQVTTSQNNTYVEKSPNLDFSNNLDNEDNSSISKDSLLNEMRYNTLQQIAGTYPLFKFFVKDQSDWVYSETLDNNFNWIELMPYPDIMPSKKYYIRPTGSIAVEDAVDALMESFFLDENERYHEIM